MQRDKIWRKGWLGGKNLIKNGRITIWDGNDRKKNRKQVNGDKMVI